MSRASIDNDKTGLEVDRCLELHRYKQASVDFSALRLPRPLVGHEPER